MHTREINEIAIKLNSIMSSIDSNKLTEFVNQTEQAILYNDMLDDADRKNLQQSYNKKTRHYEISITDKEIIKSAKAVMNLLRTLEGAAPAVLKPTIEKLIETMYAGSNVKAVGATASLATGLGLNSLWTKAKGLFSSSAQDTSVGQIMQLVDDVNAFYLYTSQLGSFAPSLDGLNKQAMRALSSIQGVLEHRDIIESATYLASTSNAVGGANQTRSYKIGKSTSDNISDQGISVTLRVMKTNIFEKISDYDKENYYDAPNDRFNIPTNTKDMKPDSINMMIAYNVSDRARKSLNTINNFLETWKQTKSLPVKQIPALLELLNKLGKVVADLNNIDQKRLTDIIRDDLNNGIKELIEVVGPILPQLASIAQETELRAGLKDGSIMSNIKSIYDQYESIAKKYSIVVSVEYPYSVQKNAIIERLSTEYDQRIAALQQAKVNISNHLPELSDLTSLNMKTPLMGSINKLPSLALLKSLQQSAAIINTRAGSDLTSMTTKLIKVMTGMDALEVDIAKAERIVTETHHQLEHERSNPSFVPFNEDDSMETALNNVRELYAIRDTLLSSTSEIHYETSSSGIGQITNWHKIPDKINNLFIGEEMDSISKNLEKAAALAYADIDALVTVEENKKQNVESHTAKDNNAAMMRTVGAKNKTAIVHQKLDARTTRRANIRQLQGLGTMSSKDIASAAQQQRKISKAEEQYAVDNEANEFLTTILDKSNGPVINACAKAKKFLIESCTNYLTKEQRESLHPSQQKDGLYIKNDHDGLIVDNIKDMHNALTQVMELMQKINLITFHLSQGDYLKILPMIPSILQDIENISIEFSRANQSLNNMRNFMSDAGVNNISAITQVYGNITQYLPSELMDMQGKLEIVLMTAKSNSASENASAMMTQCAALMSNIDSFARNIQPEPIQATANARSFAAKSSATYGSNALSPSRDNQKFLYDGIVNIISKLEAKLPADMLIHKNKDGSYNLKKFEKGTSALKIASAINIAIVSQKGFEHSERIARKDSIVKSGFSIISQILPLLKALEGIGSTDDYYKELKPFLESIEPTIMRAYAFTVVTDRTLGTSNMLTAQVDSALDYYLNLAKQCHAELKGEKPYLEMQVEIANTHMQYLEEQHLQRVAPLITAGETLDILNKDLSQLVAANTGKLTVSAIGGAERDTPPTVYPSLEELRMIKNTASTIPTSAGRTLSDMATTMINLLTGIDQLERDLAKAQDAVTYLKNERQERLNRDGSLSKKSAEFFTANMTAAENNVKQLEMLHQQLTSSNANQHYTPERLGAGTLHSGLNTSADLKKMNMGDDMASILQKMQTTLQKADKEIQAHISEDSSNLTHMRTLLQTPQQPTQSVTSTRRM